MPVCAQCMREAPEGALFCPFCRAAIVPPQPKGEPPDPLVGQTIKDAYIVQERIGVGGMGRVYRAVQISLGRSVALKLLRPTLESDTTLVQRFHREARACSRLHHPNVIQVLDFGQTEDRALFIVMEYVPGRSLFGLLRDESPLAEPRAVHLSAQILSALAEAHRAGIVHRDLKPENVMVETRSDEPEFVKVLDFGIAKLHEPGADDGQLTRTGVLCGTPNYMSPEQASLFPIDARSDLYSVGVILYEMLTGHLPFRAATPSAMAQAHAVETPPPLSERCPPGHSVSPALEALVMKALEKEPARRFQTAEEMRRELLACPFAASPGGMAAPTLLQFSPQHVGTFAAATPTGARPTMPVEVARPLAGAPTPASATPSRPPARSAPLTEELAGEVGRPPAPGTPAPAPTAPALVAPAGPRRPEALPSALPPMLEPEPDVPAVPMPPAQGRTRSLRRLAMALAASIAVLAAGAVVVTRHRSGPSSSLVAPVEKTTPGPSSSPPAPDTMASPKPGLAVPSPASPAAPSPAAPSPAAPSPAAPSPAAPSPAAPSPAAPSPAAPSPAAPSPAAPSPAASPGAPSPTVPSLATEPATPAEPSAAAKTGTTPSPHEPAEPLASPTQKRPPASAPGEPSRAQGSTPPPAATPAPVASQRAQPRPEPQPAQRRAAARQQAEPQAAAGPQPTSAQRAASASPAPTSAQRAASASPQPPSAQHAAPISPAPPSALHAAAPEAATAGSTQHGAEASAAPGATTSRGPESGPAAAPPPAPGIQRAAFVTREVMSYQQVFGNPELQDRGRGLVGGARWLLEPGGTLTFAPVAAAHGLFPMKVRATRDGSRVKFEGTNTARASDGFAYVRISGLLALGAADPLLMLDMEIGRALGPDGAELDPTYRARTRLRLAPE